MDLGELGGDEPHFEDDDDGDEEDDGEFDKRSRKRQRRAGERNVALQHIKTIVIISICLQNTNERCNCLQGWMGFFMKSTGVPEKVIEVMAHAGLSVSLSTIYNMVTSISKEISHKLDEPETIQRIPIHKTNQIPCRSMNIKQSTTDGNVEVLENLFHQGGIGDKSEVNFNAEHDVDMTEHVILVHGDLLTKERVDSVRNSRKIEHTPKNRLQYVVFLPGLFHYKMACADALWRTYIHPKEGREDENSLYQHIGILRPDETGKMVSKPGFRRVHDVVHHDIWASMLDCWRLEAESRNTEWSTLERFATSKPVWEDIINMSRVIVKKFIATTQDLDAAREQPPLQRDKRFENQTLRNRDELLYVDLCQAMNTGDIGHVEASFLPWIHMFKATGKHKYASQMSRFLTNLQFNYPAALSNIVRMNLLCNPTGKPFAFRAVDWVVERNNLYTKVIFRGGGPNGTLDHIIKESPLIEVYRNCHVTMENAFHLQHRTIRHAAPDMTKTIQKLAARIKQKNPHTKKEGRRSGGCTDGGGGVSKVNNAVESFV
ncbi:uncharacterized protein F5147DRAFT_748810 [Suillus discolor]|uniref:DUF6589 domain-containing protein n=1 Tax=Suillus discolor TaxID=1912936 RepID=A0A9P7JLG1_9AGAM|nr:uncharacterized protein F5147DRAFT_748810 [Suillus discolor]KAG2084330.1 hypothetical protein F5147DRAFT_748810 [Suillus discolor]